MMDLALTKEVTEDEAPEGLWRLPEGWSWAKLGELGKWTGGGTPAKSNSAFWTDGTIPWVSPKDMKRDVIGETEDLISVAAVDGSSAKYIPENSVLMVMRSGILRHTFPVAVNDRVVTLNQDLRALTPVRSCDARFLANFLRSAQNRILRDCSKDGTTVNSVDAGALESFDVPLPPFAQQRRIVARIDALFSEIADGEAALKEARKGLDLFRRALLKAAVTGELTKDWREKNRPTESGADFVSRIAVERPQIRLPRGHASRNGDLSEIETAALPRLPNGWVWAPLSALVSSGPKNGYSPKASNDGSGTLALKLTATTQGSLDLSPRAIKALSETIPTDSSLYLEPGDLLFQRGNTVEYVGIAAIFDGPEKTYVYPDLMIRVRTCERLLTDWLWRVANSPYGRSYMADNATGTAGTMPKISGEVLRQFPIPVPPPAEIAEIIRRVSKSLAAADDTLKILDAEASDVARLKQSILKSAFEGRLVPQDPNDEPAAALLARGAGQEKPARTRGGRKSRLAANGGKA